MAEDQPKRFLDIGAGKGNNNYEKLAKLGEVHAIERDPYSVRDIAYDFPSVKVHRGSAQSTPYPDAHFDLATIYFPHNDLLAPGLQTYIPDPRTLERTKTVSGRQWYDEFHRILKPEAKLVIWGDEAVKPEEISELSKRYFDIEGLRAINLEELQELGSDFAKLMVEGLIKRGVAPQELTLKRKEAIPPKTSFFISLPSYLSAAIRPFKKKI